MVGKEREENGMRDVEIGTGKRKASAVVLGCMRIGGMSVSEVGELVETALSEGITAFDHADIYGGGKSEEVFGEVLAGTPGLRERMFLQSKCGIRNGFFDFSREHIVESVEGSLKRLRTDHLDLLLLHRPDALMETEEVAEAFDCLKSSGKVLDFGVSNMNPMQIELIERGTGVSLAANQLQFSAAHTPMLDGGFNVNMASDAGVMRDGSVLEYCRLKGIAVQAWSALQYGYFEGTFLGNEKFGELNRCLERIGAERGVTSAAVAIAWILRYPGSVQAVVGSTKKERVRELAKAGDVELTREEWYEIYRAAGNQLP